MPSSKCSCGSSLLNDEGNIDLGFVTLSKQSITSDNSVSFNYFTRQSFWSYLIGTNFPFAPEN